MPEIIGFDHLCLSVSDMACAGAFYDRALRGVPGFRKNRLEVTNFRQERRDRHDRWDELGP